MEYWKTVATNPKTALRTASFGRRWAAGILVALAGLMLSSVAPPSARADTSTAGPQVVSLSYSPSSVDVTNASASVTVTAHLTDGQNITYAGLGFTNQTTNQSELASLSLVSGSQQDGTWRGTLTVPRGAAAGAWYYNGSVQDGVNFVSFSDGPGAPQNLPAGAPGPLSVTDSSPSAGPQVVSLSYSPSSVDVTNASASVTVTAHLTDGQNITYAGLGFTNQTANQSELASLSLVSGSQQDGTWRGTLTVPRGAAAGAWYYNGSVQDGVNFVSFSDGPGAPQNLPAGAPGPLSVTDGAPTNISLPSISGTAQQGRALTESQGYWTNSPTSYSYQWERCDATGSNCQPIAGAASQDYKLTDADVGSRIRVQETASNADGSSDPAVSAATATVLPQVPATSGAASIAGDAVEGQTLSESHASWSGSPTSYSYQWQSCDGSGNNCSAIPGATGQSYTLTTGDVGHTIRVQEAATNAGGSSDAATSPQTTVVQAGPSGGGGTLGNGGGVTGGGTGGSGVGTGGSTGGSAGGATGGITAGSGTSAPPVSIGAPGDSEPANAIPTFGRVRMSPAGAALSVACRASSGSRCILVLRLTATERGKGARVLGSLTVRLAAGHRTTATIRLNKTAKRLMNQHHQLRAKLTVVHEGTAILQQIVTFKARLAR